MENLRSLKVKTLSNTIYSLKVPHDLTIQSLKEEIFKQSQVPVVNQRLVYMGKLLNNEDKLDTYVKEDEQTILMMANTQPPTNNP